jgi:DNA replication protein DnaC
VGKKEEDSILIQDLFKDILGYIPEKVIEDDLHKTFDQEICPYQVCDGSGYTKQEVEGRFLSVSCQCYKDEVLRRKLKNSNIDEKYMQARLATGDQTKGWLLQPKEVIEDKKVDKRKKTTEEEEPEAYIERHYDKKEIRKGISYFADEYVRNSLRYFEAEPRKKSASILLMGEPGRGKTHLACAIGKTFLEHSKKVYFTTMQHLINEVMNKEANIRGVVMSVDLLIVDEMGWEYHTDSQWAMKQIKELLRLRYNAHLPVIATTNLYPNEIAQLYHKSITSMFHSYLHILVEGEEDKRVREIQTILQDFDFTEGE